MRVVPFILSLVATIVLIYCLNRKWGAIPPMGKFLSPQHGFWQNAEPTDRDFNETFDFPQLKGKAEVYFDERLVPHVFAENDADLYFIQGYLHARFRLFQMDLQTKAAEGRASEIAGPRAVDYDRGKRRLGMKYAAEIAQREMESDPTSKIVMDAYTNGVNAYISSLTESQLPLEYKLLDFKPERWSNLRTALLLKMMAEMLASGTETDLEYTTARSIFSLEEFKMLYPQVDDSLVPIIPRGTAFDAPGIVPVAPPDADSVYIKDKKPLYSQQPEKPDPNNGSNNWVVAGSRTKSGAPILSNDPHLELSLPSIWYEMQLAVPSGNSYGVTIPGSPYVIIGFNDSIAWGITNSQRDVKDYYEIRFRDHTKSEYWYDSSWQRTNIRIEEIRVKGGATVYDTVAYTIFGPVMYDESYSSDYSKGRNLAVRWVAHDPSNEANTFYKLNRGKNYNDYTEAIKSFNCPGQNFAFASRSGDIAIWQQGKFPARWDQQGLYVMPGVDSSYAWQGFIPQTENPHILNPERGFLESANQRAADSSYPYFMPGTYISPRAIAIERHLSGMYGITPADMMRLQYDYFNTLAEDAVPLLLNYINNASLSANEKKYIDILRSWDFQATPQSKGQTIYQCWLDSLEVAIWKDELTQVTPQAPWPDEQTTMELLKKDSLLRFIDNINTPQVETIFDIVTQAFKKTVPLLGEKEAAGQLEWSKFKHPGVYHISDKGKSALLPFARPGLEVGGFGNTINAMTHSHGPSWRMIVHMTTPLEAYGVFPAGQSGNPGSRFYDNFVDTWVAGKYYQLWFMREGDKTDKKVKWVMHFGN